MKFESVKYRMLRPLIGNMPFPLMQWTGFGKLIILYYHVVNNDRSVPHIKNLYKYKGVEGFRDDLDFLLKYYSPIDLPEVIRWSKGDGEFPPKRFLLTFDDGFREIYDIVAPILLEKGIQATFFISTALLDNRELCYQHKASLLVERVRQGISLRHEWDVGKVLSSAGIYCPISEGILAIDYRQKDTLDRIADILRIDFGDYLHDAQPYLTSGQVNDLLEWGFHIGSHSIDHPCYADLSLPEQLEQTVESMRNLRETFGLEYGAFAFPHHDRGVSDEFFQRLHETGLVDITFGTGGMLDRGLRTHRQRVGLENPLRSAKEILSWQYARRVSARMQNWIRGRPA